MKKFLKNNIKVIIAFILGMLLSGVSVYATTFAGSNISHKKSDGTTTTVTDALNDLYSIYNYGNAVAGNILSGKTAFASKTKLTGTMANYSSSTAQSCTTANTSNKLYVKPTNAGYYTSSSSFNTGINYNPSKTIAASTSTATATGVGSTTASNINLDKDQKVTIPAGYYSAATTIQNVASGGSLTVTLDSALNSSGDPYTTWSGAASVTITINGSTFTISHDNRYWGSPTIKTFSY